MRKLGASTDSDQQYASDFASIDRRRGELVAITCFVIVALASAFTLVAFGEDVPPFVAQFGATATVLRVSILILVIAFTAYLVDKERKLRRALAFAVRERELASSLLQRLNELLLVGRASREFVEARDLDETFDAILRSGLDLLGADQASIMLVEGQSLVIAAAIGRAQGHVGEHVPDDEGVAAEVAGTRTPRLVTGTMPDAESPPASAISAPLIGSDDVLVGVLNLSVSEGTREFNEHDLRAVTMFTGHAATAITRARERRRHLVLADAAAGIADEIREPLERIRRAVAKLVRDDIAIEPAARRRVLQDVDADVQRAIENAAWLTKPRG